MPQSTVRVMNKKRITGKLFNEILHQVKLLLTLKGGCSEREIKNQLKNLKGSAVEAFLSEAIERGIIEVDMGGTYSLDKLKV